MKTRRAFIKSGALFVPAIWLPRKASAQYGLRSPQFAGGLNRAVAAGSSPASFSDDFNRADADPMSDPASGGTWTSGPGVTFDPKILANALASGDAGQRMARVLTPAFSDNQSCTGIAFSSNGAGVMVRVASVSNASGYLLFYSNGTTLQFYKGTDNGTTLTFTQMGGNVTVATMTTPTLRLTATGGATTTLEGFLNGVSIGTRDDSSSPYTSGQPGLYFQAARSINAMEAADL